MASFDLKLLCLCLVLGLATAKHLGPAEDGNDLSAHAKAAHHQHQHQHLHQPHQHQHSASTHHRRRLQRDSRAKDTTQQCEGVKNFFESIDIKTHAGSNEKGHVLELAEQSENKTLNVFIKVYSRMVPLSRKLIHQLYTEIISHLKYTSNYSNNKGQGILSSQSSLEEALHRFFEQLFPVAYHQAVHPSKESYGELHEDYINCLKHNYDELQPFGQTPKEIQANLLHSVHMSKIFMNALLQTAEVLSEVDALYGQQLTDSCKLHLLKMHYCPDCNGHQQRGRPKVCYSYCMNVMRGCSAQYAGMDSHWSNVVEGLDSLVSTHIRSDSGIMNTIKQLDAKLSEAIMRAMENGPELEKKVKKTCGTPNLLPSTSSEEAHPLQQHNSVKWSTPLDPGSVQFLSTIEKSKDFYSNIVLNFCDEDYTQRDDHLCWTGDRIGDYTQLLMTPKTDTQRYNPEVPWENKLQSSKISELIDKLNKIRKSIAVAAPAASTQLHDIQSDMGHEGSAAGASDHNIGDDDEEYGGMHGSGDGSGDGATPDFDPAGTTPSLGNEIEPRDNPKGAACSLSYTVASLLLSLVTLYSCSS